MIAWKSLSQRKLPSALAILKKVGAESLGPPPKFQGNIEIQLNTVRVSRLSFRFLWLWINKLYERSIRIALNDKSSEFNELLENSNDICNHHSKIQILLIEVFKKEKWTCPSNNWFNVK